jgi:hypothetical protein
MYKIEDIRRNYGQIADILNGCDSEDIPIFIQVKTYSGSLIYIPIDNFAFFKEVTAHDPEDIYPLKLVEYGGVIFLQETWEAD